MDTYIHNISSSQIAFTSAGVDVFNTGHTNFVISFSGAQVNGDYIKFLVEYTNDSKIYTVTSPTDNINDIFTQTIEKKFVPTANIITTYSVDVSGIKTNLTRDRYRINLKIGRNATTSYGSFKIVNSTLFTNKEHSNLLMLTLEGQSPRYIGNVLIPFNLVLPVKLPHVLSVPDDNSVLRIEPFTQLFDSAYMPIVIERSKHLVISETQYAEYVIGVENGSNASGEEVILYFDHSMYPNSVWTNSRQGYWVGEPGTTAGQINRGDTIEEYLIMTVESGNDYSAKDVAVNGGTYDDDMIINVTIEGIYVNGLAP